MVAAFPLQWPTGRPRTKVRRGAPFNRKTERGGSRDLTIAEALDRLQRQLDLLKATDYVLSSNLRLRLDGMPASQQSEPDDPAVALYFQLKGQSHCLPCDTFERAADNIAAIAKHIEATRAIERYGVASVREMFTGFAVLPAPGARRPWREVFGYRDDARPLRGWVDARYRELAKVRHPDKPGGSHDLMSELTRARDEALKEIG